MSTSAILPSPSNLLGVPKYDSWYPGQESVFRSVVDWYHGDKRFLGLSVAAGSGKSLNAVLAAKILSTRTCILTNTKGLQEQYMRDVSLVGGVNVKGRNNFSCVLSPNTSCEDGPCRDGVPCVFRVGGCPYYDQLNAALESDIVVTNYAYYLAQSHFSSGLGDFGLLVMDEAHLAFGAVENHVGVYLSRLEVESVGISMPRGTRDWIIWQQWASDNKSMAVAFWGKLEQEMKSLRLSGGTIPGSLLRSSRTVRALILKLTSMASASGRWVVEPKSHGWSFTPVWVSRYGDLLYQKTPKVMMMSALLSEKTMNSLGVDGDRDWISSGSYFPINNTPVWHIPTTRVNYRSDDASLMVWVSRIDQIIQRRQGYKGIVFTVSYDRMRLVVNNSRYADIMMTHSTGDVVDVVNKFKAAAAPRVLVSPSVTSGWDFPECDYIVIGKIPYPDTTDPVMKARKDDDRDWPAFVAMETLANESARGTRSESDCCEVYIIDDNITWFMKLYRHFSPQWFLDRYRGSLSSVPDPIF